MDVIDQLRRLSSIGSLLDWLGTDDAESYSETTPFENSANAERFAMAFNFSFVLCRHTAARRSNNFCLFWLSDKNGGVASSITRSLGDGVNRSFSECLSSSSLESFFASSSSRANRVYLILPTLLDGPNGRGVSGSLGYDFVLCIVILILRRAFRAFCTRVYHVGVFFKFDVIIFQKNCTQELAPILCLLASSFVLLRLQCDQRQPWFQDYATNGRARIA